jgi:hypothetical protein
MATAYGSIASATHTYASPDPDELTINKPASLAAGDMMIAVVAIHGTTLGSWTAPAGWTALSGIDISASTYKVKAFFKVADSGDAAASNFLFTMSTADSATSGMAGFIIRVTGSGFAGAGNITAAAVANAAATGQVFTPGITPPGSASLYIMGSFALMVTSQSAYAIASNNPSWTERADITIDPTGSAGDGNIAVATALASAQAASGDYSLTLANSIEAIGFIIAVNETANASPAPAVISTAMNIQAPVVAAAAVVSPSVVGINANIQAPAVATGAEKWINDDKTTPGAITNDPKS